MKSFYGIVFLIIALFATVKGQGNPSSAGINETGCRVELRSGQPVNDIYFKILNWTSPKKLDGSKYRLQSGQTITLECENGFLNNEFISKQLTFECRNGKLNRTFLYEDLLCRSDFHKHDVVTRAFDVGSRVFKCDSPGLEIYQVKVEKPDGNIKHLYTVCLDTTVMRPKFAFEPKKNFKPYVKGNYSRDFDIWGYAAFGKTARERLMLSKGYTQNYQKNRFNELYGRKRGYPHYFNRGHLVPYADFIDHDEQKATSQYINAAPQWQIFNENAWSLIEREVRHILRKDENSIDYEIYTGTYGTISTPTGLMFLTPVEKTGVKKGLLTVPMLYWKVLLNTKDRTKSRAFVGVNNPDFKSVSSIPQRYRLCKPIRDQETNREIVGDEYKGFTYECDLDEFLNKLRSDEGIVK